MHRITNSLISDAKREYKMILKEFFQNTNQVMSLITYMLALKKHFFKYKDKLDIQQVKVGQ